MCHRISTVTVAVPPRTCFVRRAHFVAQAFLPAGPRDFPVARLEFGHSPEVSMPCFGPCFFERPSRLYSEPTSASFRCRPGEEQRRSARDRRVRERCFQFHPVNRPVAPEGAQDISRGQTSLRVPPPVTVENPPPPRMGRWKGAVGRRLTTGLIRRPTPLQGAILLACHSRRRARRLACAWLISAVPPGPIEIA